MAGLTIRYFCTKSSLKLFKSTVLYKFSNVQRSYISTLFVPGNLANKTFAFLSLDLDFESHFTNTQKLQQELNSRGLKINAEELKKVWNFYQNVVSDKNALEKKNKEILDAIKNIKSKELLSSEDEEKQKALEIQNKLVKQDIKSIKEVIWDLQEKVIPELLKLPNEIDERTPAETSIVLKSIGEKPVVTNEEKQSHIDIGKNLDLLDYRNPIQCYLCNEAAVFELEILSAASRILNENNFIRIAGNDFCRSIVVEGCGIDHESSTTTFILQNTDNVEKEFLINRLHLVGGSSLPAMIAYFIKHIVKRKELPLRVFSTGRQYSPFPNFSDAYGLFSICQASTLQTLILTEKKFDENYENQFQSLINTTSKIYDELDCHYRIVIKPANELSQFECMRVAFEMWSVYSNRYIEVGHVSSCGDYCNKRLLIGYQLPKKNGYSSLITGTLLSVPRVLGCLLEENPNKFVLPEKVRGLLS